MGLLDPIDEHLSTMGVGGSRALCFGVVYAPSPMGFGG